MKVKDQSPTVVVVDVSRGAAAGGMKSNDEASARAAAGRRQSSETTRPAPPRRSMHYDGKPSTGLVLWIAVNSLPSLSPSSSLFLPLRSTFQLLLRP